MLEEDVNELLPVNLLPEGTTRFSSAPYAGRVWHIVAVTSALTGCALALVGTPAAVGAGVALLAVATVGLALWWRFRIKPRYDAAITAGTWPWGILVFSSGDISVTLPGVWRKTELTIEVPYLSRADAVRIFSLRRLWWGPALQLFYLSLDARPRSLIVDQMQLLQDVAVVADVITTAKNRATAGSLA